MVAFLGWSIFAGLLVYALEMTGFILLGDLIGSTSQSGRLRALFAWSHLRVEYLVIVIFALKLVLGFALAWISTRLMKRLLLVLTREVASRHLAFGKVSSTEQGDLPNMMRNCLTLIAYLDGNYFRQLSIISQELIMLLLVAAYMIASYGWVFALAALGLAVFFGVMRKLTGRRVARLGHEVVNANAQIVRAINELHRMRKELNVWGALPMAVHRIESGMDRMMAPNYTSELILAQIRPALELAAVIVLVAVSLSGAFSSGDIIIIGLFVLRTLPSLARLQVGVTTIAAAASAKQTIQGVLKWG